MSLCVGLGASQADLDVQGEIDFDFFEESDCSSSVNKSSTVKEKSETLQSSGNNSNSIENKLCPDAKLNDHDLNVTNVPESCSSQYFNKPVITVSCDDMTGMVQKTTIETIIPTPFNYKDNKCGRASPDCSRKGKKVMLSPRLKSKIFSDDAEISDDSSISSMSESESDLSSDCDDSIGLNESDSMTDVTPLMSPYHCSSPMPEGVALNRDKSSENILRNLKKEGVKFTDNLDKKECSKCEAIDINELLKAVKRLEMGQDIIPVCKEKCSTPSVITQNAKCRKNLSFSNEEVRRIDNDNQVLLKKIVAQQNRSKPRGKSKVRVVSSASVNRQRHQRQIELENLALLKRLESTKASKNLSRSQLLKDYDHRSSGILSRASSRASKSACSRTSSTCSGRSSAISCKSTESSKLFSDKP